MEAVSVPSAHRKAMIRTHQGVPDGNSEISVSSVLKKTRGVSREGVPLLGTSTGGG